MLKIYIQLLIFVSAAMLLSSCEEVVELPVDTKPRLVVFSNFSDSDQDEKGLEVYVYKIMNSTDTSPVEYVEDAVVKVYKGNELLEQLVLVADTNAASHLVFYQTTHLSPRFDVEY
jgi:hypothetical protein